MSLSAPFLAPTHRWRVAPPPPASLAAALPDVHPVLLRALVRRGLDSPGAARAFLAHDVPDDNPFRMAGMSAAVTRLRAAVRAGQRVAIYGDYDADGVTATALLVETLTHLGADVCHFIPHRARDGYGVHGVALDALRRQGVRVVVTVDCGIRSATEVAAAAAQGLDVIVTDHHVLPEALPRAIAVLNPRRPDCDYGFANLAGVGLAYKLAQGLLRAESRAAGPGRAGLAEEQLLDLVAIGTVADVVPLIGENRSLVARGLAVLRSGRRPGVRALAAAAGLSVDALSARAIGFNLAPRINAAGRMDDADAALALLLAPDDGVAVEIAAMLEVRNDARRRALDEALVEADAALAGRTNAALLAHCSSEVGLGVMGLVAGRLSERYYRPALVVRVEGDVARGSARSIPELDITAALETVAPLLVRFGGHRRAAGFTVRTADLPELLARLTDRAAEALDGLDLRPTLDIDADVRPSDVDWDLAAALAGLEPCGEGNASAVLRLCAARVRSARIVGHGHLKLALEGGPGGRPLDAIAFGQGACLAALGPEVDVIAALHESTWNGTTRLELRVLDLASPGDHSVGLPFSSTGTGEMGPQ